jgi:hypothetical protein
MKEEKTCSVCGVPRKFSRDHVWNSDGTVTQASNPDNRLCFFEADSFERLFHNIEELVGMPIDRVVVDGKRKSSLAYIRYMFPGFKQTVLRALRRRVYQTMADTGAIFGLGKYELLDFRKGEFIKVLGRNVYSLPMFSGDLKAVFNFVEGIPADLAIEERGGGYLVTLTRGEESEELAARFERIILPRKPGKILLEKCPQCGLPLDFKEYEWDLEEGVVTDTATGRHMVFTGPLDIDSIFRELEAELGEEIPRTVVEAERQYVAETLQQKEFSRSSDYLFRQFAKRGLGNLVQFELKRDRLQARVENATPILLIAGMLQGIYELVSGKGSTCEFKRGDDGTLEVIVTAA